MEGELPDLPPVISLLSDEEFEPGFLDKTVSAAEFFDLDRWVSLHCYTMQKSLSPSRNFDSLTRSAQKVQLTFLGFQWCVHIDTEL